MNTTYHATLRRLLDEGTRSEVRQELVEALLRLGCLRLVVTPKGLAAIAEDGMVTVAGVRHVQDCERVRLAARGSRRRGECTCGSDPS